MLRLQASQPEMSQGLWPTILVAFSIASTARGLHTDASLHRIASSAASVLRRTPISVAAARNSLSAQGIHGEGHVLPAGPLRKYYPCPGPLTWDNASAGGGRPRSEYSVSQSSEHRDPADQLLLAAAIELACSLVTDDERIARFGRNHGRQYGFVVGA